MTLVYFQNKCGDEKADILPPVSALIVTGKGSLLLLNFEQSPTC